MIPIGIGSLLLLLPPVRLLLIDTAALVNSSTASLRASHNQPWSTNRDAQNAVSVIVTGVVTTCFLFDTDWPRVQSVPGGSSLLPESSNVTGHDRAGSTGRQRRTLAHELTLH